MVENEYAEDDYTASKIDDQLDFSVDADPDTNIDISYQNALVFNETYQHHLNCVLETLQEALQENQNRQLEIESELEELEQGRLLSECNKKYSEIKTDSLLPSNPLASNNRKATVSIFAAPYFKVSLPNTRIWSIELISYIDSNYSLSLEMIEIVYSLFRTVIYLHIRIIWIPS